MEKRKHVFFSNEEKQLIQQWINSESEFTYDLYKIDDLNDEEYYYRSNLINSIEYKLKLLGVLENE